MQRRIFMSSPELFISGGAGKTPGGALGGLRRVPRDAAIRGKLAKAKANANANDEEET